uniref:tRNA-synt_1 domain-containing protein n=1 Tax=Macrostomum lignano TaxID=282301 RepID=A0A1I8FPB6_9PLAT
QRLAFQHWGVLSASAEHYETKSPGYVAVSCWRSTGCTVSDWSIAASCRVHWSDSSATALAEAELVYRDDHRSDSAFVLMPLIRLSADASAPEALRDSGGEQQPRHHLPGLDHHAVDSAGQRRCRCGPRHALLACAVCQTVGPLLSQPAGRLRWRRRRGGGGGGVELGEPLAEFPADALIGATYRHPFSNAECPVLPSDHVTEDKGTGLVHVAPRARPRGFSTWHQIQTSPRLHGNEAGRFGGPGLGPGPCWTCCAPAQLLAHNGGAGAQLPYDWRTGRPVMLRASSQWFLDTAGLRDRALTALDTVRILPDREAGAMRAFVPPRPYWCISRQRVHGCRSQCCTTSTGDPVYDSQLTRRFAEQRRRDRQRDSWFELSAINSPKNSDSSELRHRRLKKSGDIFDIWMDSGLSWAVAARRATWTLTVRRRCASKVRTSSAAGSPARCCSRWPLTGRPPYKSLAVHGFHCGRDRQEDVQVCWQRGGPGTGDPPSRARRPVSATGLPDAGLATGDRRPASAAADGHVKRLLRSHLRFLLGCVSDLPLSETVRTAICHPADAGYLALLADFVRSIEAAFDACDTGAVCRAAGAAAVAGGRTLPGGREAPALLLPSRQSDRRSAQAALWQSLRAITMATARYCRIWPRTVYAALQSTDSAAGPAESPTSVCLEAWQFPDLSDSSDSRTLLGRQLLALFRLRSAAFAGSDEFAQAASAAARLSLAPLSAGWELLLANDASPWRILDSAGWPRHCAARPSGSSGLPNSSRCGRPIGEWLTDCDLGDVGVLCRGGPARRLQRLPALPPPCAKASAGDTCGDDELLQQCADFLLDGWPLTPRCCTSNSNL